MNKRNKTADWRSATLLEAVCFSVEKGILEFQIDKRKSLNRAEVRLMDSQRATSIPVTGAADVREF